MVLFTHVSFVGFEYDMITYKYLPFASNNNEEINK